MKLTHGDDLWGLSDDGPALEVPGEETLPFRTRLAPNGVDRRRRFCDDPDGLVRAGSVSTTNATGDERRTESRSAKLS